MYKIDQYGRLYLDDMTPVPNDDRDQAYLGFQAWLTQGNAPTPIIADSPPVKSWLPHEFRDLFAAEMQAILHAAYVQQNMSVMSVLLYLQTVSLPITNNHPKTIEGVECLLAAGLISQDKRDSILG